MKKLLSLLTLCLLGTGLMLAQKNVSGVVVDEKGEPIIGASIQVEGTSVGTITDYDGEFALSVPDNAKTVLVSYVGMVSQVVEIKDNMRITLKENAEIIQEVVVTGYGNVSKGSFAGSAQAVSSETIENKAPTEISKALAGEVAGVQVINSSGQPGTNASIVIRGVGSIYASSTPLYVVDGVTYQGDISSIDPGDIASTTILKDATATSLYGSRGANGVVVITTKKGNSGEEAKIDVDVTYGANMHLLPMYEVISDPQEYVEIAWRSMYNSLPGTNPDLKIQQANNQLFSPKGIAENYNLWNKPGNQLINGYTGKFNDGVEMLDAYKNMTSWEDNMFRVGQKANATVKISGGTEKVQYFTSLGYLKDEGYYIGSDFDRFTARSNVDFKAKKWLSGNINLAYTYSTLNNPGQGSNMNNGFAYVNECPPIYPVFMYNPDGTIQNDPKTGYYAYDYGMHEGSGRGFGSGINPAGALLYDKQKTVAHQVTAAGSLEIKFYKDLKFTATVGVQYLGTTTSDLTNKFYGDAEGIGRIAKQQYNVLAFTAQQMFEYNKVIGDHTIRAMAGHETNLQVVSLMYGQMNRIADPAGLEWSNGVQMGGMASETSQEAMDSYLVTATYMYGERYGITGNYRADGSSKFAKGHRWGHFGSVGASWNFTNENWMAPATKVLKNGKLRASWGVLGNQGISNNLYQDYYSIEYVDGQIGYVWKYKGNPDITWERTSSVDIGLEFSIMKYLDVELDYYYKLTDQCLMPRYNAPSLGYAYVWINGGKQSNQGVEFQMNVHAVDTRNVKLNIRLNGGHNHNNIIELPKDIVTDEEMLTNSGLRVGHSRWEYSLPEYLGVNEEGLPVYVGYYDPTLGEWGNNEASTITEEMRETAGTVKNYISDVDLYRLKHPDVTLDTVHTTDYVRAGSDYHNYDKSQTYTAEWALDGGFGIDLEVYGVTLNATCSYRIGGYGYDGTYAGLMGNEKIGNHNWHVDMRNMWTEENTNTNIPRLDNAATPYINYSSSRFLTSNSYLSLNNIRLGYRFPKKLIEKIKLSRLELFVQGDNLAIVSARKGYNPMVSITGASNSYQYTPLSTVIGGIKVQF